MLMATMNDRRSRAPGYRVVALLSIAVPSAATGALLALAVPWRGADMSNMAPPASREIALLNERLDRVEQRTAEAPSIRPADSHFGGVEERRSVARLSLEALDARVARLEQLLAAGAGSGDPYERGQPAPPDPEALARRIRDSQQVILDPAASEGDKLAAWRRLRLRENAWTEAVIGEIARLGLTAADARVRADVWRYADGRSTHPALVPALLQALRSDGEADVRQEAADTLGKYVEDPDVRQALALARDNDAADAVRRSAGRSLQRFRRQR